MYYLHYNISFSSIFALLCSLVTYYVFVSKLSENVYEVHEKWIHCRIICVFRTNPLQSTNDCCGMCLVPSKLLYIYIWCKKYWINVYVFDFLSMLLLYMFTSHITRTTYQYILYTLALRKTFLYSIAINSTR